MNNHSLSFIHWRTLARQHPSGFLLAVQLVSLVLYAAFNKNASGQVLTGVLDVLILLLVLRVIVHSPAISWIGWILVAPAFVLSLLSILFIDQTLLMWAALFTSVLYFYAVGSLVIYMMNDYRVTIDELFAAGATFTLLAWGFAYAYQVCQILVPGSFFGSIYQGQPWTFLELLSLSFTNLSATGLGDILPVTSPARVLVMLEQFSGVAYIAVVVSRLIGMTITIQKDKSTL
jgi:hypothetical protein